MAGRGQISEPEGIGGTVRRILVSVAVGTAVCVGILLLLSLLLSVQSVPQALVNPMAIFAVSAGALVSGFCCARLTRKNGLLHGAACGLALSLVVLLASLAVSDGGFGVPAIFKVIFMLLSAMLGGVLGVNTRHKRRK